MLAHQQMMSASRTRPCVASLAAALTSTELNSFRSLSTRLAARSFSFRTTKDVFLIEGNSWSISRA